MGYAPTSELALPNRPDVSYTDEVAGTQERLFFRRGYGDRDRYTGETLEV